jgi:hypothetical protein
MALSELRELQQLRDESVKLKKLVADLSLDRHMLQPFRASADRTRQSHSWDTSPLPFYALTRTDWSEERGMALVGPVFRSRPVFLNQALVTRVPSPRHPPYTGVFVR